MERVAVCVCTAGRPAALGRLLDRLAGAEVPAPPPLLVIVDNRPGGAVADVIEAAHAGLPFEVVPAEEPRPGITFARDRAVAVALGAGAGLVAFIDDDDLPRPDWLVRLVEARARTGADVVLGGHRPDPGTPLPRWARRLPYLEAKPADRESMFGVPSGGSTCNALLTRAALLALSGGEDGGPFRAAFGPSGGEDTDLFVRARRLGLGLAVARESEVWRVWEPERLTRGALTRRAFRFGVARAHLRQAHLAPMPRRTAVARALRQALRRAGRLRSWRDWFALVEQAGEAYGLAGGRFAYYGDAAASTGSAAAAAGREAAAAGDGSVRGAGASRERPSSPTR